MSKFLEIKAILEQVQETDLKEKLLKMHETLKTSIEYYPASCQRHHKNEGGYADHIYQVMSIGCDLFDYLHMQPQAKSFMKDDVILVAYVHDLNKLWRYKKCTEDWKKKKGIMWDVQENAVSCDESAKVAQACAAFGIYLQDKHLEAVSHHHGGWSNDFASKYSYPGSMTPLSTLIHSADLISQYFYGQ